MKSNRMKKLEVKLNNILQFYCFNFAVIGGRNSSEGNVYAYNPTNAVDGPVCDDMWNIEDVRNGFNLGSIS